MARALAEEESSSAGLPRLDERVRDLLSEIPGAVAFQGLRRTLNVHPESLSRALRRLEREGAVERTGDGYRLANASPVASADVAPLSPSPGTHGPLPRWDRSAAPHWSSPPQVELRLSRGEDAAHLMQRLAGHWFGAFRWVGSYQEGRASTLLWVSRAGTELLGLVLEGDLLRIYEQPLGIAKSATLAPPAPGDRAVAAYELLQHVLTVIRGARASPSLGDPAVLMFRSDEAHGRDRAGLAA